MEIPMTEAGLRSAVGIIAVIAAPILTAVILLGWVSGPARDASIMLATLAWQHAGTVIRSLFPGPEINVDPKKDTPA
jgi:hypothetical protein